MPEVSIIIPNYNHANFLVKRIDSILEQTYQDFEVIILDDCSTDTSKEMIEQYRGNPKISKIIYNEVNSGSPFKQWKKGIELASGKYIWLAESDDYADKCFLETMIKPFHNYPDMIISYAQSIVVDDYNNQCVFAEADAMDALKWKQGYVESAGTELSKYLNYRNTIPNASAVLFKKPESNVLDQEILGMSYLGDWMFWKKLLSENGKIAFCHQPLNFFRAHGTTTRQKGAKDREIKRFKEFRKFFPQKSFFNIFESRYDWIIVVWFHHRKAFKGSLQQFIPNFPIPIILRTYWLGFKKIPRLFHL